MNRKDLIFAAIALSVLALFFILSRISEPPKPMTARSEHAGLERGTPNQTCLQCHALTATIAPMPENHPKKGRDQDQRTPCTECHKAPATSAQLEQRRTKKGDLSWLNRQPN